MNAVISFAIHLVWKNSLLFLLILICGGYILNKAILRPLQSLQESVLHDENPIIDDFEDDDQSMLCRIANRYHGLHRLQKNTRRHSESRLADLDAKLSQAKLKIIQQDDALSDLKTALKHNAMRDSVSNVYNSRYFLNHLQKLSKQSQQENTPLSLILMEVILSESQRTAHHGLQDKLLRKIGKLLDSYSHAGICASRIGDMKFGLLAKGMDRDNGVTLAEYIRRKARRLLNENQVACTDVVINIGLSSLPTPCTFQDAEAFLQQAETALGVSAMRGGNCCCHFDSVNDPNPAENSFPQALVNPV